MKRLLFVVPDARFFVTHRMALAVAARDAGYDVHVATPPEAAVAEIEAAGLAWHRARFGPLRRKPWSDLQSLLDLTFLYRHLRPHIVHHVTFKAVLYGTIAARLHRVPIVVNAMTGLGDVFAADTFLDRLLRAATTTLFRLLVRHPNMRVIVQNEEDRQTLVEARCVDAQSTVLIRGSGVDPTEYTPERKVSPIPTVTLAARIVRTKGIVDFVAAARLLRERGVRARFVLAGDRYVTSGQTYDDAEFARWRAAGVEYLGMLDDIRPLYAATDIACLPSWGGEGVPKSLIEAASCALPIVTTDVPGCRDIVRDGENGLLVPAHEPLLLADALERLIEDPALRQRMGARSREIVVAEFTLDRVIEQTLAVYAELERGLDATRSAARASTH